MLPRSLKPFLLIGAAKSGTTSLFADICQHPDVFLPPVKEPGDLCHDSVLTPEGREKYLSIFRDAPDGAWIGDASTTYTMRDTYPGVAERAIKLLGKDIRIIFIGREPLERIKSLYRHHILIGRETLPLRDLSLYDSFYFQMSKYDYQLNYWFDFFEKQKIILLRYEDYEKYPGAVVRRVWRHLDLEAISGVDFGQRRNVSSDRRIAHSYIGRLATSQFYKRHVRRVLPESLRHRLQPILSRKHRGGFADDLPEDREQALRRELMEACRNFYAMAERFE